MDKEDILSVLFFLFILGGIGFGICYAYSSWHPLPNDCFLQEFPYENGKIVTRLYLRFHSDKIFIRLATDSASIPLEKYLLGIEQNSSKDEANLEEAKIKKLVGWYTEVPVEKYANNKLISMRKE
jgi:hypothetical protein